MKELLKIFISFAKVGVMTFGGGYAMIPMLRRECVERRGWVSEEEMLDYFSLSQCVPGVIAVNTSAFIGRKARGAAGAVAGALGMVFPSLVIIIVISALITSFADLPAVKNAFAGIRACVCALILNTIIRLFKPAVHDWISYAVFICVLVLSVLLDPSPVLLVLGAAAVGVLVWGVLKK